MHLWMIFGAGAMTYLTPCILPIIPIYLAALGGGSPSSLSLLPRRLLALRASLFVVGFITVFTLLGLGASQFGGVVSHYKGTLQTVGGVLMVLFGLKMLGLIHIPRLDRVARVDDTRWRTPYASINAMLMGVLFAAGWSPCVGPILGSVLTYTASKTADAQRGALYLGVYGMGLALPLLLTAVFVEPAQRLLGRLRRFVPLFERATGVALLAVAGSLLFGAPGVAMPPRDDTATAASTADGPALIELYARDCPVCREMAPVVAHVAEACAGTVAIHTIDVSSSDNRHWVGERRVVGVPTFLFVDPHGNEVARLVGRQSQEALEQSLAALTGESCAGVGRIPGPQSGSHDSTLPEQSPSQTGTSCQLEEAGGKTQCGI